jgi:hypothetical protein
MYLKLPHVNSPFGKASSDVLIDLLSTEDDLMVSATRSKIYQLIREKKSNNVKCSPVLVKKIKRTEGSDLTGSTNKRNFSGNANLEGGTSDFVGEQAVSPYNLVSQHLTSYEASPSHSPYMVTVEHSPPSKKPFFLPEIPIYSIPKGPLSNFMPTRRLGNTRRITNVREFLYNVSPPRGRSPLQNSSSPARLKQSSRYAQSVQPNTYGYNINHLNRSPERVPVVRSIKIYNQEDSFADYHINNY